jgi:cytochrome c oxidase cbb3-type subunit IV
LRAGLQLGLQLKRNNQMDVNTLRIAATLACMAIFAGILYWTFAGRNRARFQEAAQIPFEQD